MHIGSLGEDAGRVADESRGRLAAGTDKDDERTHDIVPRHIAGVHPGGVRAEEVVLGRGQRLLQLSDEVLVEHGGRFGKRAHVGQRQQPAEKVGALVTQRDEFADVVVGKPDHARDERHR